MIAVINKLNADVCPQVDAEGAGALVLPHALAHMGHGLCGVNVCLLLPWEVTSPLFESLCSALAQFNQKPNEPFSSVYSRHCTAVWSTNQHKDSWRIHLFTVFLFYLQVQIGGAVGLRGHGGSSCSGHTVYGESNRRIKHCLSLLLSNKRLSFVRPSSGAAGFLLLSGKCQLTSCNCRITIFQSIYFQVEFLSFSDLLVSIWVFSEIQSRPKVTLLIPFSSVVSRGLHLSFWIKCHNSHGMEVW